MTSKTKSKYQTHLIVTLLVLFLFTTPLTTSNQPPKIAIQPSQWLYVGGNGPGNYSTIQAAIDNATDSDTIYVYQGIYQEYLTINKKLTLIGQQKNHTIINATEQHNVITITHNYVTITGFTLTQCKPTWQNAAINIQSTNNITILNNNIKQNHAHGIYIQGPTSFSHLIQNNTFTNNEYGIYIKETNHIIISDNHFIENGEGIYLVNSANNEIINNYFSNKWNGLHLENIQHTKITHNLFFRNSDGAFIYQSYNITINNNSIIDNDWFGIKLSNSDTNTISYNLFQHNDGISLYLDYTTYTKISYNEFDENDDGIFFEYASHNTIQKNNFRNHKLNAYFVASTQSHCQNHWRNNYWDRPRILPAPIFGKIKLEKIQFNWINLDLQPLQNPFVQKQQIQYTLNTILYVGGDGPNNYTTIQAAVDNATNGDTIFIYNGTYYEQIIIDKELTIIGEDKNTTCVDGTGYQDIFFIMSNNVTVKNICIQNGHYGISLIRSSHSDISNTIIYNNLHGISLHSNSHNNQIYQNNFSYNQYGIRLYDSSSNIIQSNRFISYKTNAFFVTHSIKYIKNSWSKNYWSQTRNIPYLISGKIIFPQFSIPWINIDWTPGKAS